MRSIYQAEAWDERPIERELLEALKAMVAEKRDYMLLNNLGNPEEQHTIKQAAAAIAKAQVQP